VLVLAAGMAVDSGPEAVSAEEERGPDLRGEWAGTYWYQDQVAKAHLRVGSLRLNGANGLIEMPMAVTDEGSGTVSVMLGGRAYPGIFKQEGDLVTLCFDRQKRPTSFKAEQAMLLTLYRVKPGK